MAKFTVLSAELLHETNTFCRLPTTLEDFAQRGLLYGGDAIAARKDNNTELAGFLDGAQAYDWQMVHVLSAHAQPGGAVTRDAFDRLTRPIIDGALRHKEELSGILLGLHGAMVTDFCDDGEGELLMRLRAAVGMKIPIGITLDPHANISRTMCDLANIIISFKTYPHTDMRLAGRHASDILQRAMSGEIHPVTLCVKRPMLEEVNGGRTDIGPMIERLDLARAYERQPDVFAVSVNGGFANADIADAGPSILVTAQGDLAAHALFASGLANDIWDKRNQPLNQYYTVDQAAALCKDYGARYTTGSRPIVLADYADNPGGGAYGDSTSLVAALLAAEVDDACFAPMVDQETVQQLHRHQPGDTVQIRLGGKTDPRFGGLPLDITCKLVSLSNGDYVGNGAMIGGLKRSWGPCAVIQVGGLEILVVTLRAQILDLMQFRTFGIDPSQKKIVVLKSMQHFRAAFEPIAGEVIVCDSGALCTLDYPSLPFTKVPRPLFPFDQDLDMGAWLEHNQQGIYIPA
jgi:microcystin degradation protein MlrC